MSTKLNLSKNLNYCESLNFLFIQAAKLCNDANSEFCLSEALHRYKSGYDDLAKNWLLRSLAYSVGKNHPIYTQNC